MSDAPLPDGTLLRRYRDQRDETAFAELRRRHERLVFSAALRETDDRNLAEDATQGAFLLLMRKRFPEDASLAGWLFNAGRLVAKNLLREERRRRCRERQAFQEFDSPEAAWPALTPHLNGVIATLRPGDREAILLRFGGEMSLAEVGAALGIGENAARMRVARALERMRETLRRAGVGISVLALASLLSTRLAEAAPSRSGPPSAQTLAAVRHSLGHAVWKPALLVAAVVAGPSLYRRATALPTLPSQAVEALFARSNGEWQGNLVYADDGTKRVTETATRVRVEREQGGLRLVARFPSYAVVDTTTIRPSDEGRYRIETRGSHRLDGEYRPVRLRDGRAAFQGVSPTLGAEVRLIFSFGADSLQVQEEALREGEWHFRNRYALNR